MSKTQGFVSRNLYAGAWSAGMDAQWNPLPPPPATDHRAIAVKKLLDWQVNRDVKRGVVPLTWVQIRHPSGAVISNSIPDPAGNGMWVAQTVNFTSHGFKLVSVRHYGSDEEVLAAYIARDIEAGDIPVGYVAVKQPEGVETTNHSNGPLVLLESGEILAPARTAGQLRWHKFVVTRDPVKAAHDALVAETRRAVSDQQIADRLAWPIEAVNEYREAFR